LGFLFLFLFFVCFVVFVFGFCDVIEKPYLISEKQAVVSISIRKKTIIVVTTSQRSIDPSSDDGGAARASDRRGIASHRSAGPSSALCVSRTNTPIDLCRHSACVCLFVCFCLCCVLPRWFVSIDFWHVCARCCFCVGVSISWLQCRMSWYVQRSFWSL
jgi:hypothetical protein